LSLEVRRGIGLHPIGSVKQMFVSIALRQGAEMIGLLQAVIEDALLVIERLRYRLLRARGWNFNIGAGGIRRGCVGALEAACRAAEGRAATQDTVRSIARFAGSFRQAASGGAFGSSSQSAVEAA
jgi:hypothetical protein